MSDSAFLATPALARLERYLDVSVFRHSLISSNLANIDTPGYRTRDLDLGRTAARPGRPAVRAAHPHGAAGARAAGAPRWKQRQPGAREPSAGTHPARL